MPTTRKLADINPSPRVADWPCRCLAQGVDTYVETYSVIYPDDVRHSAENSMRVAKAMDAPQSYMVVAGDDMQVSPYGARGFHLVMENPDITLMIRKWDGGYNTTVRYSSAGLWQHGLGRLRDRARSALAALGQFRDVDPEPTLSRFDYALDFDAPLFEARAVQVERFVQPGHGKAAVYVKGLRAQTFTIGKLPGLQVTLYDKTQEIRDASGKEWMFDIWGLPRDHPLPVWRVEVRMGGEFLKDRNVRGCAAILGTYRNLVCGALIDRRLTEDDDARVRRASVHPLWWSAIQAAGNEPMTIAKGRRITGQREELRAMTVKGLAGYVRAASMIDKGDGSFEDAAVDRIIDDVRATIAEDPQHARKVDKARERYVFLGAAR